MKLRVITVLCGIIAAIVSSFASHSNAWELFRYRIGLYDRDVLQGSINETITEFNKYYAKFFNTGGDLEGLNKFPAANLIKRRVVQEINSWNDDNKVLVHDKFEFHVNKVEIMDGLQIVVDTDEEWLLSIQTRNSRGKTGNSKRNHVQVRYYLKLYNGAWKVVNYEVYQPGEAIPAWKPERFQTW